MCNFKSAIVMKNGDIIHHHLTQSHEDLIDLMNIKDNGNDGFVRVEYTSKSDELHKIGTYELKVDEETTPEWFENFRKKTEKFLKSYVESHIITDTRKLLIGETYILAGSANIINVKDCRIESLWENSSVGELRENSSVGELRENSKVIKDCRSK